MADAPAKLPPPAHSAPDDEIAERRTIRDYYIILRERVWIALPLAILIAVAFCYKKMQVHPTYYAVASMQFDKPETVVNIQGVIDQSLRGEVDLNTSLEILRSSMLRTRVLESFSPEEKKILQRAGGDPLGVVTPSAARNSLLIEIRVVHDDPEAAALVANRYMDEYRKYLVDNLSGANDTSIQYLVAQAASLQKEAEEKEQELQSYIKKHNLISLDNSNNLVTDALRKSDGFRVNARLELLGMEDKLRQVDAYKAEGKNLLEIPSIAGNPAVAIL